MGVDFKGVDEDVNNSVVPWYVVQGSDTYSSTLRKRKLGGDGGDIEYPGGVHHRPDRRISGMTDKYVADRMCQCPPVVATLEAAVLYPVQEYISRHQAKISAQVAFCPIYKLCTEVDWRPGTSRMIIWWDQ